MMHSITRRAFRIAVFALLPMALPASSAAKAEEGVAPATNTTSNVLWQIGKPDGDTREFALGPGAFRDFGRDAYYIVGQSSAQADWPYVHPGPVDSWAGGKQHTFCVLFGLKKPDHESPSPGRDRPKAGSTAGAYRLVVDLADVQRLYPPLFTVTCNGQAVGEARPPAGSSDQTIEGDPSQGTRHQFVITVPAEALRDGANEIALTTVSGCWVLYDALRFEGSAGATLAELPAGCRINRSEIQPGLVRTPDGPRQPGRLDVIRIGPAAQAEIFVDGAVSSKIELQPGRQEVPLRLPPVDAERKVHVALRIGTETFGDAKLALKPVRPWEIYFLHHTHLDIGYTHTQEEVEQRQMDHLDTALALIKASESYPPEARFTWLPEGLWAVESYLKAASSEKRAAFTAAVRAGRIGLDALYANLLTGLCDGEELFAALDYAQQLRGELGVPIDSAMMSDVPGNTWGLIPVLAQRGVKYLNVGPNRGHRVGRVYTWGDKPFYWEAPDGQSRVLFWLAGMGYSWFLESPRLDADRLFQYIGALEQSKFPYDMVILRYAIGADNGPPDPQLSDFVKQWNETYVWPRVVLANTSQAMGTFEKRYGDKLPVQRGDLTPYWEDGALSTAADTAVNRGAREKLQQAAALWAMVRPGDYPAQHFYAAWREVQLYDEHTWGAWNSISAPDDPSAVRQAQRKQQFALDADRQAQALRDEALAPRRAATTDSIAAIEVYNPSGWPRTDLVLVPATWKLAGNALRDATGNPVITQKLSTGELAFVARDVPPLGSVKYVVGGAAVSVEGAAIADGMTLSNGALTVTVDEKTGCIASCTLAATTANLVDAAASYRFNEYIYVAGRNPENQKRASAQTVRIAERGFVVGALEVVHDAPPGAKRLTQQVRVVADIARVDLINTVDKLAVRDKEAVHFALPFGIADPTVRIDTPWAIMRPEVDQLAGACKNYFCAQRWVDVAGAQGGVTLATVDAPLIQMGEIRTDVGHPFIPAGWLEHITPSATLFSYVMNNYWETNYKADQSGPATFRYSLRPYTGAFDAAAATRFGLEQCQPLVVAPVAKDAAPLPSLVRCDNPEIVIAAVWPSAKDGELFLRACVPGDESQGLTLTQSDGERWFIMLPNSGSETPSDAALTIPARGVMTVHLLAQTH